MNIDSFNCPIPISDYKRVLLAHGGGGRLTSNLITKMFFKQFGNKYLQQDHDGALLNIATERIAFTTDSFVVHPLFPPGGNIGSMAVHGTINDIAMCGAQPKFLSLAFILEEGLEMETLWQVVCSIEAAAREAGVKIVTGDTKVVDKGKCDGMFINTSGIGEIKPGLAIRPSSIQPGDEIIVSGALGNHGMAIMATREGLEFESEIVSDSASVVAPVLALLDEGIEVHCFRDPTRGGLASSLNEIANSANLGIEMDEAVIPVAGNVKAACEILGLDPLYVANEGRFVAFVPAAQSNRTLDILHQFEVSEDAVKIGQVINEHPGMVVLNNEIGGKRVVDMLSGEQLPRIC